MEFSNPPAPHEREWRHPAEVAAEQRIAFQQADARVGIILAAVGGIGVLISALTILIAFSIATPYRPVSSLPGMSTPGHRVCESSDSVSCTGAPESVAVLTVPSQGSVVNTIVTGTTVAVTTTSGPGSSGAGTPASPGP